MGGQPKTEEAARAALADLLAAEVQAQPHTFPGARGDTVVTLSMRTIYNAIREGTRIASGSESLEQIDLEGCDDVALAQAACCEIEIALGIYPNVPGYRPTKENT